MDLAKHKREISKKSNPSHAPAIFSPNDDPVFTWETPEYEHTEKHPRWYWVTGGILLAIIVYAIVTDSILMAITFIFIGMLAYVYAEREPRRIRIEINPSGIVADRIMYDYDNLKSFWMFYEIEHGFKVLSLHSKKTFMPYIHIPVGDTNPILIREVLLHYLPEIKQEMTIIDRLSLLIGL